MPFASLEVKAYLCLGDNVTRRYETDRASQFTGLQGLLTVTETSTIKQSCLLSQHKEGTRVPNISDPVVLLSQ